ncbi:PREDICTED: restriction of telomere capping protein 5 isoform X1 [Dinoponera quadriceps]|uniref:Restriction of telomere capping protein 5 isoform X1 n=1 Tax=Dinoponera quadriceps TaxID=609295 RepID=A0A6P3X969_DINQU|nr:PREDICTED: restriction of telomere capping protein 5 isoform X1 [Dinoponera quadriceps]XP_014474779.1 PREDICTED: restriction of telomere capping protein 5 isoform X1 [Dinoponera quadriceps]
MGNQVTRVGNASHKKAESTTVTGNAQGANAVARSASKSEPDHNSHMQFFPIESLAKTLSHLAHQEEHVNGITKSVFQKYLFPNHPELSDKLFTYLHHNANATTAYISIGAFKQQAEKFLSVMNDQAILENYIKMYSNLKDGGNVTPDTLKALLMCCHQLTMENNSTGLCLHSQRIISAVVVSCFHGKSSLSTSYVSNWIGQHCPRMVNGLQRYVVHVLTTAYRNGKALLSKEQTQPPIDIPTPVLDKIDFEYPRTLLPMSYVWLLSCTLPQCYLQTNDSPKDITHALIAGRAGSICPRHWTLLYSSGEHGTGANRFLHHVLGYRGPTLLFIRAASVESDEEFPTYCVCSAVEWRESHLYWGDDDSMGIQLTPSYKVIETGPKMLYLNTNIRGYPHGLRLGSDPRSPFISIDESFQSVSIAGAPYRIASLEVWGCGDTKLREKQLEIKKWQVKEAEKQRVVKLSASDWLDHPDRYLLELAGRASYNESNK